MGPYLQIELSVIRDRYAQLRAALPEAKVLYAVKANPHPAVLAALAAEGSGFDVASIGEIGLVKGAGAAAGALCHGNPVRSPVEVSAAVAAGVRLFVTDSAEDLRLLAEYAPSATVLVRLQVDEADAATPFGGKFGCSVTQAGELLRAAELAGLDPAGLAFHVGSQQARPAAWAAAIARCALVGRPVRMLDVGGGFPVRYRDPVPPLTEFTEAIRSGLDRHFPTDTPQLLVEPGRLLVAEAGVLHAEVIRVSRRHDGRRWVYLDVGRYGGLAETEGEAIGYRLATPHDGGPVEPAVVAGPTCDGDDVLYRELPLPLMLRAGDQVRLAPAGAYTASYASVGFNGLPPLYVRCV